MEESTTSGSVAAADAEAPKGSLQPALHECKVGAGRLGRACTKPAQLNQPQKHTTHHPLGCCCLQAPPPPSPAAILPLDQECSGSDATCSDEPMPDCLAGAEQPAATEPAPPAGEPLRQALPRGSTPGSTRRLASAPAASPPPCATSAEPEFPDFEVRHAELVRRDGWWLVGQAPQWWLCEPASAHSLMHKATHAEPTPPTCSPNPRHFSSPPTHPPTLPAAQLSTSDDEGEPLPGFRVDITPAYQGRIGQYSLHKLVGDGGLGNVFTATHLGGSGHACRAAEGNIAHWPAVVACATAPQPQCSQRAALRVQAPARRWHSSLPHMSLTAS